MEKIITGDSLADFTVRLREDEKAEATIEKYSRDVKAFADRLSGREVTKEAAAGYKRYLQNEKKRGASGVNGVIAAMNSYFSFMEWGIKLKSLKIQKRMFRAEERELSKGEYKRLVKAAQSNGNERLNLILQTICSTGIRVSELPFITLEAVISGSAVFSSKGKARTVFIPKKLRPHLLTYARKKKIQQGCIFVTKSGKQMNRSNIWAEMKKLCQSADVAPSKVFPHNLRSLFARLFYSIDKDVARLADLLGHSSVNTTRIYLMESGDTHRKRVDSLGLVMT